MKGNAVLTLNHLAKEPLIKCRKGYNADNLAHTTKLFKGNICGQALAPTSGPTAGLKPKECKILLGDILYLK